MSEQRSDTVSTGRPRTRPAASKGSPPGAHGPAGTSPVEDTGEPYLHVQFSPQNRQDPSAEG